MKAQLWIEVEPEVAANPQMLAILDSAAAKEATTMGRMAGECQVSEQMDSPKMLVWWELIPR